ncbi:peptidoglycan-binding domain-containing protein [Winogradskyella sp. 3972H.M.0a.05]|uniref:peptidoglycan-binding domain-containing protein n=1 Tax=Winogradskyella sp. 3972H.M.0a.05 TaxID=2950277 RepID=UPI003394F419
MGFAEDGYVHIPKKCSLKDKIDIAPIDAVTYDGITGLKCPLIGEFIQVYKHKESKMALSNAFFLDYVSDQSISALSSENKTLIYGQAALAANEVYNLDVIYSDSIRKQAREKVIYYTCSALGVENGIFTSNDYVVPNDDLILAIENFQRENGLEVTKKIDAKTLQALSQKSSYEVFITKFDSKWETMIEKN